jgi:hypothetical protein
VRDLAVGAFAHSNGLGGRHRIGAVFILLPPPADGTLAAWQKIGESAGGFTGTLNDQASSASRWPRSATSMRTA